MEAETTTSNQAAQQSCRRCGACCVRGGPALHDPDIAVIHQGGVPLNSLYTIRPGERAYDNVSGGLFQVTRDIVKIKSAEGSRACMYYDDGQKACLIYEARPLQCRLQACWDNNALEGLYASMLLSRRTILENARWLCEMMDAHEEYCHFQPIHELVDRREEGDPEASAKLTEIVNYDAHFRDIAVSKGQVPADILDFLFGRPLARIIEDQFGIKVSRK